MAPISPEVLAASEQARAAWEAVDVARQTLLVTWIGAGVNAAVVAAAFVVPWIERKRTAASVAASRKQASKDALNICLSALVSVRSVFDWIQMEMSGAPKKIWHRGVELEAEHRTLGIAKDALLTVQGGAAGDPPVLFALIECIRLVDRFEASSISLLGIADSGPDTLENARSNYKRALPELDRALKHSDVLMTRILDTLKLYPK